MLEASQRQMINAQAVVEALQQQLAATQAQDAQDYRWLQEQAEAAAHNQVTVLGWQTDSGHCLKSGTLQGFVLCTNEVPSAAACHLSSHLAHEWRQQCAQCVLP